MEALPWQVSWQSKFTPLYWSSLLDTEINKWKKLCVDPYQVELNSGFHPYHLPWNMHEKEKAILKSGMAGERNQIVIICSKLMTISWILFGTAEQCFPVPLSMYPDVSFEIMFPESSGALGTVGGGLCGELRWEKENGQIHAPLSAAKRASCQCKTKLRSRAFKFMPINTYQRFAFMDFCYHCTLLTGSVYNFV